MYPIASQLIFCPIAVNPPLWNSPPKNHPSCLKEEHQGHQGSSYGGFLKWRYPKSAIPNCPNCHAIHHPISKIPHFKKAPSMCLLSEW